VARQGSWLEVGSARGLLGGNDGVRHGRRQGAGELEVGDEVRGISVNR